MVQADRLAQLFVGLADTLVADFDLIGFLHTLTDASVEVLDVQAAGLMLADQRGMLRSAAATGNVGPLEDFELAHGHGPCVDCFTSGSPVVNLGRDEARRRWPEFSERAERAGYLCVHALPLRLRGQVIGAINLYCVRHARLETVELNIAQALADVATIGLLQERIIRDKTVLTEQLQSALNSRILIEQAKGIIAERHETSPSDAFTALRDYARKHSLPLAGLAASVLDGTLNTTTIWI
jgi:transcriptional regulator with GAF, ATPase, and Fis domain